MSAPQARFPEGTHTSERANWTHWAKNHLVLEVTAFVSQDFADKSIPDDLPHANQQDLRSAFTNYSLRVQDVEFRSPLPRFPHDHITRSAVPEVSVRVPGVPLKAEQVNDVIPTLPSGLPGSRNGPRRQGLVLVPQTPAQAGYLMNVAAPRVIEFYNIGRGAQVSYGHSGFNAHFARGDLDLPSKQPYAMNFFAPSGQASRARWVSLTQFGVTSESDWRVFLRQSPIRVELSFVVPPNINPHEVVAH
ncbi:uncharacterized protein JCM15063_001055 [Sporobolomyces koalae]|uniref:uncharacterized protein n=1 Tax=Sporobolomyces koalae TaxID=500713 RepID=UPI0031705BE9